MEYLNSEIHKPISNNGLILLLAKKKLLMVKQFRNTAEDFMNASHHNLSLKKILLGIKQLLEVS